MFGNKDMLREFNYKRNANVFDEYRSESSQQSISKLNPTTYKKDHTP